MSTKWSHESRGYSHWLVATCEKCRVTAQLDEPAHFSHCGKRERPPDEIIQKFARWEPDTSSPIRTKAANRVLCL